VTWRRFGPEWNPVLGVLSVLAVLCVLATLHWWLGIAGLVAAVVVVGVLLFE
jgi:hypothetical protein